MSGGGISIDGNPGNPLSSPDIINTIVTGNSGNGGIYFGVFLDALVAYGDFSDNQYGNFTGNPPANLGLIQYINTNGDSCDQFSNIFLNPQFYSTTGDSAYYLTEISPCIDAGDPSYPPDPDSTISDMGAYYFHQWLFWQITLTCTGEEGTAPNQFFLSIGGGDHESFIPAPPPPPQYMCYTQLWDTTTIPWGGPYSEMIYDWVDTNEYVWTLEIDPNGNVMPPESRSVVFTWNPEDIPESLIDRGFYIIDDNNNVVISDMSEQDSLVVTGESTYIYYIKYGLTSVFSVFDLPQYWSLISLPVIPDSSSLSCLFPNATVAYAFENGTYVQATELENEKAYWVYVPDAEKITVWGEPFTEYNITVDPPWEMLGGVSIPAVPVVEPGNIVVMYRFDQTYYTVPSFTMEPGSGYWVNFTEEATTFSLGGDYMLAGSDEGGLVSGKNKTGKSVSSESGNWELALNIGGEAISAANNFILTIGRGESSSFLPAPPAPPDYSVWCELYEEEWASGPYFTMIQPLDSNNEAVWLLSIDPNGNITPPAMRAAVVEWDTLSLPSDGVCYIEDCSSGEIIVEDMRAGDSFEIEGSETRHFKIIQIPGLEVGSPNENFPDHYVLEQNRPNPFNPSTQIRYYLRDAGKVKLTIYNIMGEEVAVLVNNTQSAGYHTVNFEGSNLPSGIYFYRLKAGDFSDIKKMIIVK